MGRRGPRPTPTKILRLRGSWRALRRAGEVEPPAGAVPPSWLSPAAREHWDALARPLKKAGLLTVLDADVLGLYLEQLVVWLEATEEAGKKKKDRARWWAVRDRAWDRMIRASKEFGMTPSARAGLKADAEKAKDPLASFVEEKLS